MGNWTFEGKLTIVYWKYLRSTIIKFQASSTKSVPLPIGRNDQNSKIRFVERFFGFGYWYLGLRRK